MTLHHTSHKATTNKQAEAVIYANGGTPAEREVGYSLRYGKPGSYRYIIRNNAGESVYHGDSMADGMAALEATLSAEA